MSQPAVAPGHGHRGRWVRLVIVGLLLPLAAAAVLGWSVADRQQKLDKIPVAIVNNDTILTDPQPMAAGRALSASLTNPKPSATKLDWTLTDSDDAKAGLRRGDYYAVLTIPSDFSQAILSSGTDKPVSGKVTLVSNAAASTTAPYISAQVVAAAADSLGNQTTQGYLKNVYGGFNQLAKSNQSAASSAASLADGTAQVAGGADQLTDGTDTLASSLGQVASGTAALHAGTQSLQSGAAELDQGVSGVSGGARKLHRGSQDLASSSRTLARKGADFAGAADKVADGSAALPRLTGRLADGSRRVAGEVSGLVAQCSAAGGSVEFCLQLRRARDHTVAVAAGSELTDRAAVKLSAANKGLATGADSLAAAEAKLARGAQSLSTASGKLSRSTVQLLSGAEAVSQGAVGVNDAAGQLVVGTEKTSSAADSLATGSKSVSSGATSTDSGAHQLSSGLAKGAKESPTYSTSQQDTLADVVSTPVVLSHSLQHTSHGNGWLLAAIVAVVLWLAALVGALGVDVSAARRNALAPVSSRRLALTEVVPVVGLALVQVAAVVVATWVFHADLASTLGFVLLSVLAAVTFSVLAYALRLAFGGAGITIFVLFLLVQIAALGNVIPLETAPSVIRTLNGMLPLTAFTNGASQLANGGGVGSLSAVVTVLVLWGVGAFFAALMTVKRQRLLRVPPSAASAPAEAWA